MSHNGGRVQLNPNFLQGREWPFLNIMKHGQGWAGVSSNKPPVPANLNSNGWPIAGEGVYTVFLAPGPNLRPGNHIIDWVGTITSARANFSRTTISGSPTGTNGRWVFTLTDTPVVLNGVSTDVISIDLGVGAWDAANPVTQMRMYHADDEALVLAGEVFSPFFKQKLAEVGCGVFRTSNYAQMNTRQSPKWAYRTPIDYATYGGAVYFPAIDAGTTTNSGDAFTATYAGGATLADKLLIHVAFNITPTGTTPTLNTIPIKDWAGNALTGSNKPQANRTWTLMYDSGLAAWLGGDGGVDGGVPEEHYVRLANEVGCHIGTHLPYLAVDPPSDWTQKQAELYRDGLNNGLKQMSEPMDEIWNGGTRVTQYGNLKATARWGGAFTNDWYGMICSRNAEIMSGVYSADRSRYEFLCGIQSSSFNAVSASNARLTAARWVAEGGGNQPAYNWVTAGVCTTYINSQKQIEFTGRTGDVDPFYELPAAISWQTADAATRTSLVAPFVNHNSVTNLDALPSTYSLYTSYVTWKAFFQGFGINKLFAYEGSWSPDFATTTLDDIAIPTAITKGATTSVTITSTSKHPVAGLWAFVQNVSGMTELNNQYIKILSVAGDTLVLNVDSTGYSTYTSGGTLKLYLALPITGITKANPAVITTDGTIGKVARDSFFASIVGVSGMTEINNANTKGFRTSDTVWTSNSINSTGYSTYTSGGFLLVPTISVRTDFREATLSDSGLRNTEYQNCVNFTSAGCDFPSLFQIAGQNDVWSALQPTIRAADTPKWLGFKLFGTRRGSVRLTAAA